MDTSEVARLPARATAALIADALAAAGLPAADAAHCAELMTQADLTGAAWVGVRRSNHAGPAVSTPKCRPRPG
jgi:LDH2 family malate/lactate/ureidoglycolate dehydrogenase